MAERGPVDIESSRNLIDEFSATSAKILDVIDSINDSLKDIHPNFCGPDPMNTAEIIKLGSSWKRTDRIIQEVCCIMREMCRAYEEYETADPGLTKHLF